LVGTPERRVFLGKIIIEEEFEIKNINSNQIINLLLRS